MPCILKKVSPRNADAYYVGRVRTDAGDDVATWRSAVEGGKDLGFTFPDSGAALRYSGLHFPAIHKMGRISVVEVAS